VKYLVTGATGFIGLELCRQIRQDGHELIAFSLRGEAMPDGTPTRAVDFSKENLSAAELNSVDTVFHLAAIAHQQAAIADYDAVNHCAVLELARQAHMARVKNFVFLSSVKAMGAGDYPGARSEQDCISPRDPYGLSKWQAESGLNREFCASSMRVCILRPALVYGQGAKANLAQLLKWVGKGLPRPPAEGARSMISNGDLCSLMRLVAVAPVPGVSTFIATDGESYSTQRLYDAIRDARAMNKGIAWCPRWAWWLGCGLLDLKRRSAEPTRAKLFATELYSNAAVLDATPWRPRDTFESTLKSARGVL
jgi:nucleoside-diphosphate-sugar epimerase